LVDVKVPISKRKIYVADGGYCVSNKVVWDSGNKDNRSSL
jgi:hypothetical protein